MLMMMMEVMEYFANEQDDCDDQQGQTLKGDPPVGPICRVRASYATHSYGLLVLVVIRRVML